MDSAWLALLPQATNTIGQLQTPAPVQQYQGYQSPYQQVPQELPYQQAQQPIQQIAPPLPPGNSNGPGSTQEWMPTPADVKFFPIYESDRGLTLYALIMTRHPPGWSRFFRSVEHDIRHACTMISNKTLETGRPVYPPIDRVLAAFWLTPPHTIRAVIIGQDPYPGTTKSGEPKAVGVCFASDRASGEIPDSLVTVYRELERTVEDWKNPGHADIRCWGRQGVLLLNAALTVEAGNAKSHFGFWKTFTESLMTYLNENTSNVVFLLWGAVAQKAADTINAKHYKLMATHPSSMNAGKDRQFGGCDHFNLANQYLVSKGVHPIDWRIPP
jgi:uracil-DNA glycosylase